MNLIRNQLMDEDSEPLSGDVEVDEPYHGGSSGAKAIWGHTAHRDKTQRAVVFGMIERGGKIHVAHLPNTRRRDDQAHHGEHVPPASMIFYDEWPTYRSGPRRDSWTTGP